ncbi:hypothetical protein NQZ68_008222 [Dissostichus eleginoides]|nr:hypothetical protein NQZ68_008222 [Dissostichus eleginoides]
MTEYILTPTTSPSPLLKLFLPPRARRQPLLCANSLHLSHSTSPHLSSYIISHRFTCFQMFPSHTHCTLYSPCFISHDIHPYFLRSPRGPGGRSSSPRDTGFRGRGPSRPGCSGLSGPGHPGLGRPGLGPPGLGRPGLSRTRRSGVPSLWTCNTFVTRLPALKTLYVPSARIDHIKTLLVPHPEGHI